MSLQTEYARLLIAGNTYAAYAMERQYALDGLPPELVSVGLKAIDEGRDPMPAIERAFNAATSAT